MEKKSVSKLIPTSIKEKFQPNKQVLKFGSVIFVKVGGYKTNGSLYFEKVFNTFSEEKQREICQHCENITMVKKNILIYAYKYHQANFWPPHVFPEPEGEKSTKKRKAPSQKTRCPKKQKYTPAPDDKPDVDPVDVTRTAENSVNAVQPEANADLPGAECVNVWNDSVQYCSNEFFDNKIEYDLDYNNCTCWTGLSCDVCYILT